jgi:hypothetical protein
MKKEIRAEIEKIACEELDFASEAIAAADDAAKDLVRGLRENIESRLAESLPAWIADCGAGDPGIDSDPGES